MLCDDIIRLASNRRITGPQKAYFSNIAALIHRAGRFALDNEAIDVIMNVEEARPSSLAAGIGICRLPYKYTFIESNVVYRIKQSIKHGYDGEVPDRKHASSGLLLVASDDTMQRGHAYNMSSDGIGHTFINPVQMEFDLTAIDRPIRYQYPVEFGKSRIGVDFDQRKLADNAYTRRVKNNLAEIDCLMHLENMFSFICIDGGDWVERIWNDNHVIGDGFMKAACRDWEGERRFIIGLLLLLNSRNLTDMTPISVRAKNHQRSPRSLPALVSHTVVTIRLTKSMINRANAAGLSDSERRWHKVRGHWKVRKTGVFFWHPYTAGNLAKGIVDKTYRIKK